MNRVKVGFFSLSHPSTTGDDRPYLEWHQLDHLPEQYQLPGMIHGQRWASTSACRAARAGGADGWSLVDHVVLYLMGDPVDRTVDEFIRLGDHLAELGRFPESLPSQYKGALTLLEAHVAPRVLVSPEVVPFRPHRGLYLLVEELTRGADQDDFLQKMHVDIVPELVSVPGVAGVWIFATSGLMRRTMFTEGRFRMTVCYLDDEPSVVGRHVAPLVDGHWSDAPSRVVLAAPFESMMNWDWDRFGPNS